MARTVQRKRGWVLLEQSHLVICVFFSEFSAGNWMRWVGFFLSQTDKWRHQSSATYFLSMFVLLTDKPRTSVCLKVRPKFRRRHRWDSRAATQTRSPKSGKTNMEITANKQAEFLILSRLLWKKPTGQEWVKTILSIICRELKKSQAIVKLAKLL